MNYIFFGTSHFSVIVLRKLVEAGFIPRAVVCSPDKPVGKKQVLTSQPVKSEVQNAYLQTEVLQPERLDEAFLNRLNQIKADFYIVAAYANILPGKLLGIPKKGVLGVHPALLPKFRGPSPIQEALLEGATETGVTLYLLDEKVDHGPMLASRKQKVESSDTYESLHDKLAELSGELLVEILPKFVKGEVKVISQNEAEATYTKKFESGDAYVSPEILESALNGDLDKAEEIERMVRALNPEPGVWTLRQAQGKPTRIKILEAKIVDNRLKLVKIQEAGKKPVLLA